MFDTKTDGFSTNLSICPVLPSDTITPYFEGSSTRVTCKHIQVKINKIKPFYILQTTIVPSLPCALWNLTICLNGNSQMISLFNTKNGSESSSKRFRIKARGPAVPSGSSSKEIVILIPNCK